MRFVQTQKIDVSEFMAEVYLQSSPSLNLDTLDHMANPNDYTIKESIFDELLKKYDLRLSDVCFLMLNKGPKIAIGQ